MNISLDYDDTFTRDPEFWKDFLRMAKSGRHKVWIVTLRDRQFDYEPIFDELIKTELVQDVIFCSGKSKRDVTQRQAIPIHIWIDDYPEGIANGTQYSNIQLEEWRAIR